MNKEFFDALDLLEREKGIPKEYMLEKVEAALVSAFKREIGGSTSVRIVLDPVKKDMKVLQQKTVVEEVENPDEEIALADAQALSRRNKIGSVIEFKMDTKNFRRLSAQAAKQVIIQAIREAERNNMIRAYEEKKDEIITALVDKVDPDNGTLVLETGEGRATLLKSEQLPGDDFKVGDHVKVLVTEVRSNETRGPVVLLSRSHPGFVKRLFELEIPEIAEGIVVIKGVARDAGSTTKVAVYSRDESVDAVGACIGTHGMRIDSILDELCGEKIQLIKYSEDIEEYVASALSPATVISAEMESERMCRVTVAPDQLSLAIGAKGQNVRLAVKLTGVKIDINAEGLEKNSPVM